MELQSVELPTRLIEEAKAATGKRTPRAAIAALVKARKATYARDDGPLKARDFKTIDKMAPQGGYRPTRSLIPGL